MIRRGAVELLDRGTPVDLLGEGEMFGHPSVLSGQPTRYEVRAREDTLCYSLAAEDVIPLLGRPSSLRFLARSLLAAEPARARRGGSRRARGGPRSTPRRPGAPAAGDLRAGDDAPGGGPHDGRRGGQLGAGASSDDGELGIVTDRDLRSRVVAGRLSPDDPVSAAMSAPVIGVGADQTGADVMLTMLDNDIRHVPVFSPRREVLGVIVAIDLVAAETSSPFVLRRAIARARNKRELQEAAEPAALDGGRASSRRARRRPRSAR